MRYSKNYCFDTDNGYLLQPHTFQNFKGKNNLCSGSKLTNLFLQSSLPAFDAFVSTHRPGSRSKRCAWCQRSPAWARSVCSTLLTDTVVCGCDCVWMFATWPCTSLGACYTWCTVPVCGMYCGEKQIEEETATELSVIYMLAWYHPVTIISTVISQHEKPCVVLKYMKNMIQEHFLKVVSRVPFLVIKKQPNEINAQESVRHQQYMPVLAFSTNSSLTTKH